MYAPEIEPYDPVTRVRVTYNTDGTEYSEAVYEHRPVFHDKFLFNFVSRNECQSSKPDPYKSHEDDLCGPFIETIFESRVLNLDENRITIMFIAQFDKGKERSTIDAIENPLPVDFVRIAKN
ncbi:MAG: hypothetical protein ACI9VI_001981 [Candidatus Azotimanducaceae bacterium]|jgi:hypothetical protein